MLEEEAVVDMDCRREIIVVVQSVSRLMIGFLGSYADPPPQGRNFSMKMPMDGLWRGKKGMVSYILLWYVCGALYLSS